MLRGTWEQPPFDFKGSFFEVEGALVAGGIDPRPDIYFGGSSGPAGPVAAKHADVYLTWGEPPEQVREKLDWMRALAREQGRNPPLRAAGPHPLARHQRGGVAARPVAARRARPRARSRRRRPRSAASESTGQARMLALRDGRTSYASTRASSRSRPTCGPASVWCAAAPGRRWSAATTRWPTGWRSTTRWASTSSSCPATRTSRRRSGSARA